MQPSPHFPWNVFGSSVPGASHVRTQTRNQDAIDWLARYGGHQPLIVLAVADGHGNPRYVRSYLGAQLAVQAAKTTLSDLAAESYRTGNLMAVKQLAEQQLPHLLVRWWQRAVDEHLAATPFTADEVEQLGAAVAANPRLAYGSTLVAALATNTYLLYVQLGDGDVVLVNAAGQPARPPLPRDERLFADATTSLCLPDAWRAVRTYLQPLAGHPPVLVMLATDGYANSFEHEQGFLAAATDILDMLQQHRHDSVQLLRGQLQSWLRATSDQGSGDDISVGILYRTP